MAPHERLDLSVDVGTHLSIMSFSRHMNIRRASEGENGIGLVSPRTRRRPPNARGARQRKDLVSANVKRQRFAAKVKRLGQRLDTSWPVEFHRRQPSIALWLLVLGFLAVQLQAWNGPPVGPDYVPTDQDRWVEIRAKDAVDRALRVIGRDLWIGQVLARPQEGRTLGSFRPTGRVITFNSEAIISVSEFELIAAHECVHAIFDHARLDADYGSRDWASCMLVEETTAYVLGAHIAGTSRTRQGGNGKALTSRLIELYREQCDWSSPKCERRQLWEQAVAKGYESIDPWDAFSIEIHFGSVELVDAIDRICRENPDPWVAAHAVAEKYIEPMGRQMVQAPQTSTAASGGGG